MNHCQSQSRTLYNEVSVNTSHRVIFVRLLRCRDNWPHNAYEVSVIIKIGKRHSWKVTEVLTVTDQLFTEFVPYGVIHQCILISAYLSVEGNIASLSERSFAMASSWRFRTTSRSAISSGIGSTGLTFIYSMLILIL